MSAFLNRSKPPRIRSFVIGGILFLLVFQIIENWPSIIQRLGLKEESRASRQILTGIEVSFWVIGAYLVNRLINRFFWDGAMSRAMQRTVPSVLKDIGTVFVYIITGACIAGFVFNQSITAFLATLGAGGVVLGFALRNLLADLFTGLAVNFDNNFAIGDWLVVPSVSGGEGTVGQVDEIGWRCTRLTCEDGTTIVLPNSILGLEKIVNISRPSIMTRFEVSVTIDYTVPVERVRRILLAALESVSSQEGFSKETKPKVLICNTGKRGVKYNLRYWIHPWHPLSPNTSRDLVLTAALQHLQTAGITPAYTKAEVFHEPMPAKHFHGHSIADKVSLLSHITIFERLEEAELERVATEMRRFQLSPDEILFRRNDEGQSLFILIEGLLNVQVDLNNSGHEQTVSQLSPGDFFGEMALLTGEPRSATIQAHTAAVIYEISRPTIIRLIENRPEISECMSLAVAQRQMKLDQARNRTTNEDTADKVQSISKQIMFKMKNYFKS
ncbi:MAG: mechanosensitive ion channel family protein [Verrucomicrobiaceae bacterium]|nr:mechanosensitive ion channel family protein [Verrucomicrobiaceae bacterium]